MFLKIPGLILLKFWIRTIIIIIIILLLLILINIFPTDSNLPSSTTIFLLKPQLNFITTTSVTLLINKFCSQKLVTSLHKHQRRPFAKRFSVNNIECTIAWSEL